MINRCYRHQIIFRSQVLEYCNYNYKKVGEARGVPVNASCAMTVK